MPPVPPARGGPAGVGRGLDELLDAARGEEAYRLMASGAGLGLVAGLAAAAFDAVVVVVGEVLLGTGEPSLVSPVWWRALLGATLAAIVGGLIVRHATRGGRPLGVPDAMLRVQLDEHRLALRDGLSSALGAAIAIGGGLSGGREGPIVTLASTLSSRLCEVLGVPASRAPTLVAAGAAAGIAASFNTPLGGAFFALEIILGSFAVDAFAPVVAATVTGTVVGQALLGDRVALKLPVFSVQHPAELVAYAALGVVCGVVATLFKAALVHIGRRVEALAVPPVVRLAGVGAFMGALGAVGLNEVMGNGYAFVEALIRAEVVPGTAALVGVLAMKILATAVTTGAGTGAGLVAPSLYLGGLTGMVVGEAVQAFEGVEVAGAYGTVGMAAVIAAVLHAPVTAALMLFEMTGNYQVMLPLMIAVATSTMVSGALRSPSIYELELVRRGIDRIRSTEALVMHRLRVEDVMREPDRERIDADEPVSVLLGRFLTQRIDEVFVVDRDGRFIRVVDIQDVKGLLVDPRPELRVRDVPARALPAVSPGQSLATTLHLFFDSGAEELPVVDPSGVLVGVLAERDVVAAYHREVLRTDARLARVVSGDGDAQRTDFVELPVGQTVAAVEVGPGLAGRALRDLGLPAQYALTVVAVSEWHAGEQSHRRRAVDASRALVEGDRLVVVGSSEGVARLKAVSDAARS